MEKRNLWRSLILFCGGLFLASTIAMKWIERDMIFNGEKISILGLEMFYPREKIIEIFRGVDTRVKTILQYHLSFDFVFMAGCFPGIASLCILAAVILKKTVLRNTFILLALFQFVAWGFDIIENYYLLKWLNKPEIGNEFGFFHFVVYSKWIIALSGALFAISFHLFRVWKRVNQKS
jgi:hypothetical protein